MTTPSGARLNRTSISGTFLAGKSIAVANPLASTLDPVARILPRRTMSVQYPSVEVRKLPLLPIGILGTDASLDETRASFAEMLVNTAQLAEVETALWRMLEEQRKTQKRVNALKYNIIPQYQRSISFVESSLEEEERNGLYQLKLLAERSSLS